MATTREIPGTKIFDGDLNPEGGTNLEDALNLALAIRDVKKHVKTCSVCCSVAVSDPCPICADESRDRTRHVVAADDSCIVG